MELPLDELIAAGGETAARARTRWVVADRPVDGQTLAGRGTRAVRHLPHEHGRRRPCVGTCPTEALTRKP